MKKSLFPFTILLMTFINSSFSQCLSEGGIGDFEADNSLVNYVVADQGNGSISLTSDEKHKGNQSLKAEVNVAGNWQVRMYNQGTCYFNLKPKETHVVSFYLKGKVGTTVNVSIMKNTTVDQEKNITITSSNWTLVQVPFQATTTSTQGRIKLIFKDVGTYYVDDLQLNQYDCNSEINGTAKFDDCGICAGGSTGILPINSCSFKVIPPTNSNIVYEGVLESEITAEKATLYRMTKEYVSTSLSGFYSSERAVASSGIKIKFKTSSPIVKAHFNENLTIGPDVFWHTFDVFKNGKYAFNSQGFEIEMNNPTGELTEWSITLPSFSMVEFLNLELLDGYSLQTISQDLPIYIAIGNSITHGAGINSFSTRLTYPFIVADSLNYELYNWGIGGSKINNEILSNLSTGIQPDLVTVLWGYNDVHYSQADDHFEKSTFPKYKAILEVMAKSFPKACIMAILPTFTLQPTNTSIRTIDNLRSGQLQIIKELQSTYSNINYMYGDQFTSESGLNDDVHLNEQGNKNLANGVISQLSCGSITIKNSAPSNTIQLHPNPTNDIVKWNKSVQFNILDASGRTLIDSYGKQANLSAFSAGIYYLKTDTKTYKVIKK